MTKRKVIFFIALTGVVLWFWHPWPYKQISLKNMSVDQAVNLYLQRRDKDHSYDWKVSLNFYGKVVDENNEPVPTAKVNLIWNTVDDPSGTKEENIVSDEKGLFSLTSQRGKLLEVRVEKDGYYTVQGGSGHLAFEFAEPSNPNYYEPDPKNPVVFHLRKKGVGAKLFSKTLRLPLHDNRLDARVNLMQGFIRPDGMLHLTVDATKTLPGAAAFPWSAAIDMSEGSLVETHEQFPFKAPESGYNTTSVKLDISNLDRKIWSGYATKAYYFYLPSTNTYGQMTITFAADLPVTVQYSYNPTPGDRYLEPASN